MRYGDIDRFHSGLVVPVSSLRSERSLGVGEFADLPLAAEWTRDAGFDLLQILPVNDTDDDASPYSARGAFALHPLYLRLEDLEGADVYVDEFDAVRAATAGAPWLQYADVLGLKREFSRRIFDRHDPKRLWDEVDPWVEANPWIGPHAVYCVLRERNHRRSWKQWHQMRDVTHADIDRFWDARPTELLFHVWLQREADRQLRAAAEACDALGVRLEGDLPILLSEDSSDVWYHRDIFDLDGRAGAPPDQYSETGQFWGFPCYQWDALTERDYDWWRARLTQASRYYHALRIDHVLGFFRIWRVPASSITGMLGHFDPTHPITREDLRARGFDDERIDFLAAPEGRVGTRFPSEREYQAIEDPGERLALMRRLWNRILIDVDGDRRHFRPFWQWHDTPMAQELSDHERDTLRDLFREDTARQEELWERTGRERLSMVDGSTDALVCAEDLGAVPDCVPGVLDELGILGLRVERWTRHWDRPGQPFIPPSDYPRNTVCSPSVHDAHSLRGWWAEIGPADRQAYWQAMGKEGEPPDTVDPGFLQEMFERNLAANSAICVLALNDLLALEPDLRPEDPSDERINTPATDGEHNWRWRMPLTLEELSGRGGLRERIAAMLDRRRARPFR